MYLYSDLICVKICKRWICAVFILKSHTDLSITSFLNVDHVIFPSINKMEAFITDVFHCENYRLMSFIGSNKSFYICSFKIEHVVCALKECLTNKHWWESSNLSVISVSSERLLHEEATEWCHCCQYKKKMQYFHVKWILFLKLSDQHRLSLW